MKKFLILVLVSLLAVISCSKKDKETEPEISKEISVVSVSSNSLEVCSAIDSDGGLSVTEYGFCYSQQNQEPTVDDVKVSLQGDTKGEFSMKIGGLKPGSTYYVRAYAINKVGVGYGEIVTVTTEKIVPQMTSSNEKVESVSSSSAKVSYTIESDGGANITEKGFCYSTKENPTIADTKIVVTGTSLSMSATISKLSSNTTYYVRPYAKNSEGISYGEQIVVKTTVGMPTVTTSSASNITATGATFGGNVTSDGGATVTERGVCWSTSTNPTISSSKKAIGSGTGSFSSAITGLKEGTTYYVRAYATNSKGTAYGLQITIKTKSVSVPTVTTSSVSSITETGATLGGNVTADGGATVTERGVCWSTSTNPTISNSKKAIGSGTGSFSSAITGLKDGTTYYVRAYATNSKGTAYGAQITIKTKVKASIIVNGAVQAAFSVSSTKKVYFSQGNLQYQVGTRIWRFAAHQYDVMGDANMDPDYNDWIDLFGWGTSGYNGTLPEDVTSMFGRSSRHYGDRYSDTDSRGFIAQCKAANEHTSIAGTNYDWGVYNRISNGGNVVGQWRTLSKAEWEYVLDKRAKASSLKGIATINGVNGWIILPDTWSTPAGLIFNVDRVNTYTTTEWLKMEANGAIFLPTFRPTSYASKYNEYRGSYWTSSFEQMWYDYNTDSRDHEASIISLDSEYVVYAYGRVTVGEIAYSRALTSVRYSVRLVRDVK